MKTLEEKLREALARLEEAHEKVKIELIKEFPHIDPYLVRDPNGRYILLDALTKIVEAYNVLGRIPR